MAFWRKWFQSTELEPVPELPELEPEPELEPAPETERAQAPSEQPETTLLEAAEPFPEQAADTAESVPEQPAEPMETPAPQPESPPGRLSPVTVYEFKTEHLQGRLSGTGAFPGIEIFASGEGAALTPTRGRLMSLTHYFSSATAGPEAAHKLAGKCEEISGDTLAIRLPASEEWPLETLVSYSLTERDALDVGFRFRFQQQMANFEAHVVSCFSDDSLASYVQLEGEWIRPALREQQICFLARDAAAMRMVEDGRWYFQIARGYHVILDERGYDFPVLVRLEEKSGWALVHMLMTDECPAISICSTPLQHGFSLVGREVKAEEEIVCHARLAYGQFRGLEGIIPLYHQFVREVREGKLLVPE